MVTWISSFVDAGDFGADDEGVGLLGDVDLDRRGRFARLADGLEEAADEVLEAGIGERTVHLQCIHGCSPVLEWGSAGTRRLDRRQGRCPPVMRIFGWPRAVSRPARKGGHVRGVRLGDRGPPAAFMDEDGPMPAESESMSHKLTTAERSTLRRQLEERRKVLRAELTAKLNAQDNPALLGLRNRMEETDDWAVADLETALDVAEVSRDAGELREVEGALDPHAERHVRRLRGVRRSRFRTRGSPPALRRRAASPARKGSRPRCAAVRPRSRNPRDLAQDGRRARSVRMGFPLSVASCPPARGPLSRKARSS